MLQKKIEIISDSAVLTLALDTIKLKKQALVFVNTKSSAEKTAEEISKKLSDDPNSIELSEKILNSLSRPTVQCERLAKCVKKNVAFHHAGLTHSQKELIEDSFREGKIRIICCTPTLAYGLDLPAFRVIIKDLRRYGMHGMEWIPVLEYMQQAGRAGRPRFDSYGEAIAISQTEDEKNKIKEKYIEGEAEEIYSKLAVEPVLRTYLLSLIATNFVNTKKNIFDFFEKTFWAFQYEDMPELGQIINKMLGLLQNWEFIKEIGNEQDFVSANEIGKEGYEATIIGKRVAELYIDPLTPHHIITCLKNSLRKETNEISFLQMISNTLEMRPLLNVKTKEWDNIQESIGKFQDRFLENEPLLYDPLYEEFANSVKTALFFNDWIDEKDEVFLLEKYSTRPGEIRVKLGNAEWLLYASEELSKLLNFKKSLKEILKLKFRIKYGVKEELFALLKLEGIGRVRARTLFKNGIKDIGDVKNADITKLIQLLGKNTALKVKGQVGQDFSKIKIKENKRKGQINLNDF